MARTNIAAQTLAGAYAAPISPGGADITFVASDTSNGNDTALVDAKTVVIAQNTGASARTITFLSVPDTIGRTGDITAYSVGVGKTSRFGAFKTVGWASSGRLRFDGAHAELVLAVITLP